MRPGYALALAGAAALSMPFLSACGDDGDDGKPSTKVAIAASDSTCEVEKKDLQAGIVTFKVSNKGSKVTEVYVYAPGDKIVSERENIAAGSTIDNFKVDLKAGKYQIACKPGMKGKGIRQDITVSGQAGQAEDPRLTKAVADYKTYLIAQADDTLGKTKELVAAVKAGDSAKAKELYAVSRVGWERTEPVAESFGDLDPKVDLREADLEEGQNWTGWHRIEKALWKTGTLKGQGKYADQLLKDLQVWRTKVSASQLDPPLTATSMANGAKELLDEVATGKVTGEEEAFSHTDLWDFKANLDGAKKVFDLLEPVVRENDAALATTLKEEFGKVDAQLTKYEKGAGYVSYDTVGKAKRKELSDAVNALGEPLSKLAGAVVR